MRDIQSFFTSLLIDIAEKNYDYSYNAKQYTYPENPVAYVCNQLAGKSD
jgi:hypothetical protein